MLRSVFRKFQTVFRQTVISPRKTCRHSPKLLPRVIIGITTGVASYYLLKNLKTFPVELKGFDYKNKFPKESRLIQYSSNSLEDLLKKHLFEPIFYGESSWEYESEFSEEFSLHTLFHYSLYIIKDFLFEQVFELKDLESNGVSSPPFFQWQYAWKMIKPVADRVEQASPAVVRIFRNDGGLGTGFFVSAEGLILTNEHVVTGEKRITIITADDKLYHGDVLSCDTELDLAVIQIEGATKEFTTIKLGDSDKITIDDSVIVIGSPGKIKLGVMSGVVSETNTDYYFSFEIETSIPTYSGASGSPVINQNGEAIGIVSCATHFYWFNKWTGNAVTSPLSMTGAISSNEAKKFLTETKNLEKTQKLQVTD